MAPRTRVPFGVRLSRDSRGSYMGFLANCDTTQSTHVSGIRGLRMSIKSATNGSIAQPEDCLGLQ